eukprot:g45096.t1
MATGYEYAPLGGGEGHVPWAPFLTLTRTLAGMASASLLGMALWIFGGGEAGADGRPKDPSTVGWNPWTASGYSRWKPFSPNAGVETVLLKPNAPGLIQYVPPPPTEQRPQCLFTYGIQMENDMANPGLLEGSIRTQEAWLYGATKTDFNLFAHPTGMPEDIIKGKLICWPAPVFNAKVQLAGKSRNYQGLLGEVRRGPVWVVRKDGSSQQAVWYFTETQDRTFVKQGIETQLPRRIKAAPPIRRLNRNTDQPKPETTRAPVPEVVRLGTRMDFSNMTVEQILTTVTEQTQLDLTSYVSALYWLGEGVVREKLAVAVVRDDPRCQGLLSYHIVRRAAELSPIQQPDVWRGLASLQVTTSDVLEPIQKCVGARVNRFDATGSATVLKAMTELHLVLQGRGAPFAPEQHVINGLVERVYVQADTLTCTQVADVFDAMTYFSPLSRFENKRTAEKLAEVALTRAKAGDILPSDIAKLMQAMVKLGFPPTPELFKELMNQANKQAADFSAPDIATLFRALSMINLDPDPNTLAALSQTLKDKAGELSAQDVQRVLVALVELEYFPGEDVMDALCAQWVAVSDDYDAADLSEAMTAFSLLPWADQQVLDKAGAIAAARVDQFGAASMGKLLDGMARLGYHLHEQVLEAFAVRAEKLSRNFEPVDIANLLGSFAVMDFKPWDSLLKAMSAEVVAKAKSFDSTSIARVLNSVVHLMHYPGHEALHVLGQEAAKKSSDFTAQELSLALNAFAMLGYFPGDEAMNMLSAQTESVLPTFDAQGVAGTLGAWYLLDYKPNKAVLRKLADHAATVGSDDLSVEEVANTLESLSYFQFIHQGLFSKFFSLLPANPDELSTDVLQQLYAVHLSIMSEAPHLSLKVPQPILAKFPAMIEQMQKEEKPEPTHAEVFAEVKHMLTDKLGMEVEEFDHSMGFPIDLVIKKAWLGIQVDGPERFLLQGLEGASDRYLGTWVHKQRLLSALGWKMARVPWFVWAQMKDEETKLEFLKPLQELAAEGKTEPKKDAHKEHAAEEEGEAPKEA